MRANEIYDTLPQPLLEMSVPKRKAEQIVTGLEQPLNLHVLKLLAFVADDGMRRHWKTEIDTWLFRIASLKLKPNNRPIPETVIFEWLYRETFEPNEQQSVEATLQFLARTYQRSDKPSNVVATEFKAFHVALAAQIAQGQPGEDLVAAL